LRRDLNEGINAQDLDGNTALHLAAGRGYEHMVKLLLQDPKLDINAVNCHGYTALHIAVESGFSNVVSVLDTKLDFIYLIDMYLMLLLSFSGIS
jgi:ankyrin repeat protein